MSYHSFTFPALIPVEYSFKDGFGKQYPIPVKPNEATKLIHNGPKQLGEFSFMGISDLPQFAKQDLIMLTGFRHSGHTFQVSVREDGSDQVNVKWTGLDTAATFHNRFCADPHVGLLVNASVTGPGYPFGLEFIVLDPTTGRNMTVMMHFAPKPVENGLLLYYTVTPYKK